MIEEVVERDSMDIHSLLTLFAPNWLTRCNLADPANFDAWFWSTSIRTFVHPQGVVFVSDYVPNLRATLHPLFWAKRPANAPQNLKTYVKELFEKLQVERLEVHVFETAGRTIRRMLRETGFTHEGTLRAYDFDLLSRKHLISTEIWSILRVEILEV